MVYEVGVREWFQSWIGLNQISFLFYRIRIHNSDINRMTWMEERCKIELGLLFFNSPIILHFFPLIKNSMWKQRNCLLVISLKKTCDLNSLNVLCSSIQFPAAPMLLPEWAPGGAADSQGMLFFLIFLQILSSAVSIRSVTWVRVWSNSSCLSWKNEKRRWNRNGWSGTFYTHAFPIKWSNLKPGAGHRTGGKS